MKSILVYFAVKYKGDFSKIKKALEEHEEVEQEDIDQTLKVLEKSNVEYITILSSKYPTQFEYLNQPPFVIFYKGNLDILTSLSPKITLTGEEYNSEVQGFFSKSLDAVIKRHTLVVNGYKGVEQKVIEYYNLNESPVIVISANGVVNPWMAEEFVDKSNCLIISEYPPNVNLSKKRLIDRNRLVAGLSPILVVYSIKKKSGLQNLITNFLNMGKEIYCFLNPENEDSTLGNKELIDQGANWITEIRDLQTSNKEQNA